MGWRSIGLTMVLAVLGPAGAGAQPVEPGHALPVEAWSAGDAEERMASLGWEAWRADVRFLAERIREGHPNPYRYVSEDEFDRAVRELDASVSRLSAPEAVVGMLRLMALVNDGHTTMHLGFPGFGSAAAIALGTRYLPVRFYRFEEGLYVVAATPEHADLVGRRVVAIDGVGADSAVALAAAAAPSDNVYAELDRVPFLLESPTFLAGLGITKNGAAVALTVEDAPGAPRTVALAPLTEPAEWQAGPGERFFQRHPDRAYWRNFLPDLGMLYIQYNAVRNDADRTIEQFFDEAFAEAEARNAERIVLDLRFNTGGNNSLNWPIIYDIIRSDTYNRRGRLFVLIGRRTFSAAQNAVNWLERHTEAVFVGEPSGAHPNHYGDAVRYTLPGSGLPLQVSALFWQHHPRDARRATLPEIFAPPTAAAYFEGRDVALEALEDWDDRTILDRLTERLERDGVDAALQEYETFRVDPRNRFVDVESDLNQFGYGLVRSGQPEAAVEVFRLVVEAVPGSANAHDSYAEGLWRLGRTEEARAEYERAIELDPDGFVGRNSRSMLERLEAGESPP